MMDNEKGKEGRRYSDMTDQEFLAMFSTPEHQKMIRDHKITSAKAYDEAAAPIKKELLGKGVRVDAIGDLTESFRKGEPVLDVVVPVLLRWLPRVSYEPLKEDIIRTVAYPGVGREVSAALLDEFERCTDSRLRWIIGNSLSVVAGDPDYPRVVRLLEDEQLGVSREMLVASLKNMKRHRPVGLLEGFLRRPDFAEAAATALGALGALESRSILAEVAASHPSLDVRRHITNVIAKLDRRSPREKES